MIRGNPIKLSTVAPLPTEFRLFTKGTNTTENGDFLFDDAAAKSVMAAYRKWGVDVAIDLDHQMLDDGGSDPTARDARGWCKLELRSDGSLWAVAVTWTPDGAQRLTQKRQRYVSPAFETDPKTKRILKLINVALVALPATHCTPALIAASARKGTSMKNAFDPSKTSPAEAHELVAKIADLLACDPTHDAVEKALQALFAVVTDDDGSGGSDQLNASEKAACRAQGCSPADFLRLKRSMSTEAHQERLRRQNDAVAGIKR